MIQRGGRLLSRFFSLLLTVFIVVSATFALSRGAPGDPFSLMAAGAVAPAGGGRIESMRQAHGLDEPVAAQYRRYLQTLLSGNLGRSLVTGRPVLDLLEQAAPATLALAGAAAAFALLFGLGLGTAAAADRTGRLSKSLDAVTAGLTALPTVGLGALLIWLFASWWHVLPSFGMSSADGSPASVDLLSHLILPALALSPHTGALLARATRDGLIDALAGDYIRTAVAKGLRPRAVLLRHALRNGLTGAIALAAVQIGSFLGGAAAVETLFSWPGLGRLLVEAVARRDYPVIQGAVILIACAFFAAMAAGDLLQNLVDPRLRAGDGAVD